MNGEDLYDVYVRKMSEQGIGVEEWGELSSYDTDCWNAMAEELFPN